jgi:exodeoxyribonuclease V gamma subunit
VTLAQLQTFARHPVRSFLAERLQLRLPRDTLSETVDDLPLSISGLPQWQLGDRLIAARTAGLPTERWRTAERARGVLRPGILGERDLDSVEDAVNELLDAAGALGVRLGISTSWPVDLVLDDDSRVLGEVVVLDDRSALGPAVVTFSKARPGQLLQAWIDLVALTAQHPERNWRAVVVRRGENGRGPDCCELRVRGDDEAARRANARNGLGVVVDCYRRGLREPLPLFAKLSPAVHDGSHRPGHWRDTSGPFPAEGDQPEHLLTFGDVGLDDLLALPAREDDPPFTGPGDRRQSARGRVARYAAYLWGAVERSVDIDRDPVLGAHR